MKITKKMFSCFLLSVLLATNTNAATVNDKKGFWITPKAIPQNSLVVKNGETFTFEGEVCVVKWSFVGNEKCLKIPTDKVAFKAY